MIILDAGNYPWEENNTVDPMISFNKVSESYVNEIIHRSPASTCELDPLPSHLMKRISDQCVPTVCTIINKSLMEGIFPNTYKHALITPLIKKPGLPLVFSSYRPVSNLTFLSKVLERIVASQILDHFARNELLEPFQSAYKQCHSTETALLRVQNDLLMALDKNCICLLILLDLSAAFDTINLDLLLHRLEKQCGISGVVKSWFTSYLHGRTNQVIIQGIKSTKCSVKQGVPQGSVLGPLLFSICMLPLGSIIRKYGVNFHFFADDTQLYITFKPQNADVEISNMEQCIDEIRNCMYLNKLRLNDSKTEFLLVGKSSDIEKTNIRSLDIGEIKVSPCDLARNLGVIFDKELNMKCHIFNVSKVAHYHLRNIAKLKHHLPKETLEILVHAFINSRIDYGNSLIYGIPNSLLHKLQIVQNCAARIISGSHKCEHITPVLRSLPWLPVKFRVVFKILMLTFKCLHAQGPKYLCELLQVCVINSTLRSSEVTVLVVPRYNYVYSGNRAFSVCAPKLWIDLPVYVCKAESLTEFK